MGGYSEAKYFETGGQSLRCLSDMRNDVDFENGPVILLLDNISQEVYVDPAPNKVPIHQGYEDKPFSMQL